MPVAYHSSSRGWAEDLGERDFTTDVALAARQRLRQAERQTQPDVGALAEFFHKLRAAWRIFFPERPKTLTPKDEGKRRLRMILVADRY